LWIFARQIAGDNNLMTDVVDSVSGSISVSPVQDCYSAGTKVTLKATAAANYTFDCWVGDVPSSSDSTTVTVSSDMFIAARFISTGTTQPSGLVGYATIQDDKATGYTLTGGSGGTAVTVSTLADLKTYLTSTKPYIVTIEGEISSGSNTVSTSITVASNKTIYGSLNNQGKLKNIELKLNGENYIIRNLVSHEVVAYDGWKGAGNDNITINGAQHVWIDHCEFYSQLLPSDCPDFSNAAETGKDGVISEYDYKDYYDGQIDISDEARWITISNNYFHDHWKSLLWGDSETDTGDAKIRVTLYHNYFKNIYSRLPMLRYGKAHVFNNYFDGITSLVIPSTSKDFGYSSAGVDARCGGTLLVEGNYYLNFNKPVFSSDGSGYVNANDNAFTGCKAENTVSNTSSWTPGYGYSSYLQSSSVISAITQSGWAGVGILTVLP
jgi:pectate lyase